MSETTDRTPESQRCAHRCAECRQVAAQTTPFNGMWLCDSCRAKAIDAYNREVNHTIAQRMVSEHRARKAAL